MVRVNRVRRIIRKVDPWTVLKVSFVFNFIISLTIVLGFSILWVLLVNAGVPQGLEEIARRLSTTRRQCISSWQCRNFIF